jgi:hypothetical protein
LQLRYALAHDPATRANRTLRPQQPFEMLAGRVIIVKDRIAKIDFSGCHDMIVLNFGTILHHAVWYVNRIIPVAPFDLDHGLDDFVVVSSMTDDLQASGQEAIPATHRNCSNGIASQIERSRVGHERVADTLTLMDGIFVVRVSPGR